MKLSITSSMLTEQSLYLMNTNQQFSITSIGINFIKFLQRIFEVGHFPFYIMNSCSSDLIYPFYGNLCQQSDLSPFVPPNHYAVL